MEKEERRRRIVERGSQRLALITGSIQNLESLPLSPSPKPHHDTSHRRIHSAPAVAAHASNGLSISQDQGHYPSPKQSHLSGEADSLGLPLKHNLSYGVSKDDGLQNRTKAFNHQNDHANTEEMQDSEATFRNEAELSAVNTRVTKASDDHAKMFMRESRGGTLLNFFTPKEINSSIISSEDTRVFCSIMIALLVVIAYANLPHHIVKSKSLIASRPLYVLLLTDVMIVILRISSAKQRGSGEMDVQKKAAKILESDRHNIHWDEAIKVLEWGLVLYQTVRAIFIDCSFYIVIVICGFSFM
nr:uncharacterized protein LOC113738459 [Coffea arabica]XP_027126323.1 uncharacterized protein LOC113742642 [Coffea arabica]